MDQTGHGRVVIRDRIPNILQEELADLLVRRKMICAIKFGDLGGRNCPLLLWERLSVDRDLEERRTQLWFGRTVEMKMPVSQLYGYIEQTDSSFWSRRRDLG